jgi:hypothetical protein
MREHKISTRALSGTTVLGLSKIIWLPEALEETLILPEFITGAINDAPSFPKKFDDEKYTD